MVGGVTRAVYRRSAGTYRHTVADVLPASTGCSCLISLTLSASLTHTNTGTLVIAEPELYSDRECEACPSTTFSASFNLADCSAWKDCSAGEFVSVFPTSANDRVCSFTRVGFEYTANENQETPLPVTKCGAGTMCAQF